MCIICVELANRVVVPLQGCAHSGRQWLAVVGTNHHSDKIATTQIK